MLYSVILLDILIVHVVVTWTIVSAIHTHASMDYSCVFVPHLLQLFYSSDVSSSHLRGYIKTSAMCIVH